MKTDPRFTITREFCGHARPRHVLRFCGEYLANSPSYAKASAGRRQAILARRESLKS